MLTISKKAEQELLVEIEQKIKELEMEKSALGSKMENLGRRISFNLQQEDEELKQITEQLKVQLEEARVRADQINVELSELNKKKEEAARKKVETKPPVVLRKKKAPVVVEEQQPDWMKGFETEGVEEEDFPDENTDEEIDEDLYDEDFIEAINEEGKKKELVVEISEINKDLSTIDAEDDKEKYVALVVGRARRAYDWLSESIDDVKDAYDLDDIVEEVEKGIDYAKEEYDSLREDTYRMELYIRDIVAQIAVIDSVKVWVSSEEEKELQEIIDKFSGLHGEALYILSNDLKKASRKIANLIIGKYGKDDWEEVKKAPIIKKRKGVVFVDSIYEFVKNFDPAFKKKKKLFYFTERFMSDFNNVEKIQTYLKFFYNNRYFRGSLGSINRFLGADDVPKEVEAALTAERADILEDIYLINFVGLRMSQSERSKKSSEIQSSDMSMLQDKLDELLRRIFYFDYRLVDPEDRNYAYIDEDAKREKDKSKRREITFRKIHTSLDGYIRRSIRRAAISMRQNARGGIKRTINCPLSGCAGQIEFTLKPPDPKTGYRSSIAQWQKDSSKCSDCGFTFANIFINCPRCMSAVPISSTRDSWKKFKIEFFDTTEISPARKTELMTGLEEEVSESKKYNDMFQKHKRNYTLKYSVENFIGAFRNYLQRLSGEEKQAANDIFKSVLPIASQIAKLHVDELRDRISDSADKESVEYLKSLITKFMKGTLLAYSPAESKRANLKRSRIERSGKISNILKPLSNNPYMTSNDCKISIAQESGPRDTKSRLKYRSIDYNASKFAENIDLVCPNCRFGLKEDDIFNPYDLSTPTISTIEKGQVVKEIDLDTYTSDIEKSGFVIGNTDRSAINLKSIIGDMPIYEAKVRQSGNSSFEITNLSSGEFSVNYGPIRKVLLQNQSIRVGTGASLNIADRFTYRLNAGNFIVRPNMFISDETLVDDVKDLGNMSKTLLSDLESDDWDSDEYDIASDIRNDIFRIVKAYCKTVNPAVDSYEEYINSFEDYKEEQTRIIEMINNWMLKYKFMNRDGTINTRMFLKIDSSALDALKDIFVSDHVNSGEPNYEETFDKFKKSITDWYVFYRRQDRVTEAERRGEDVSEEERELEERRSELEGNVEYVSRPAISKQKEHSVMLDDFIKSVNSTFSYLDLGAKWDLYRNYRPAHSELYGRDFLDRHILQDHARISSFRVLTERLNKIPDEVKRKNTIGFSREEQNNIREIESDLSSVFKATDRYSGEMSSFSQIICDDAGVFFEDEMNKNDKVFDVMRKNPHTALFFGKKAPEKQLAHPYFSFEFGKDKPLFVEKTGRKEFPHVINIFSDANIIITKVHYIMKEGAGAISGYSDMFKLAGNKIYLRPNNVLFENDRVLLSGMAISKLGFYDRNIRGSLALAAKNIFGDSFKYELKVPDMGDLYIHPIIYKTGLDKELSASYEEGAEDEMQYARNAYKLVINRLRKISQDILGQRMVSYMTAIHHLESMSKEDQNMFWNSVKALVSDPIKEIRSMRRKGMDRRRISEVIRKRYDAARDSFFDVLQAIFKHSGPRKI